MQLREIDLRKIVRVQIYKLRVIRNFYNFSHQTPYQIWVLKNSDIKRNLPFGVRPSWLDYALENHVCGPVFLFYAFWALVVASRTLFSFYSCFALVLKRKVCIIYILSIYASVGGFSIICEEYCCTIITLCKILGS